MTINIKGKLPDGHHNGLGAYYREFIQEQDTGTWVMIAVIDVSRVIHETDDDSDTPVLRIKRAEIIRPADMGDADRLIRRAIAEREGDTVLPLEMEDELQAIFAGHDITASFEPGSQSTLPTMPDAPAEQQEPDWDQPKATDPENDVPDGPTDPFDDPFGGDVPD